MVTLNISIPEELMAFIEALVNTGEYQSTSDYLCNLIRHDREGIELLLIDGLDSGKCRLLDMSSLRKKAEELLKKEQDL